MCAQRHLKPSNLRPRRRRARRRCHDQAEEHKQERAATHVQVASTVVSQPLARSKKPDFEGNLSVVPATGGASKRLDCLDSLLEDAYLARVDWKDNRHLFVQILSRDQKNLTSKATCPLRA